jgi:transketolase
MIVCQECALPLVHLVKLSVGIGAAQAKKLNGDKHIIYTLHGDGELQEGQNWKPLCMPLPKKLTLLLQSI